MNDFNQTDIASGYELTLSKAANKSEAFDILRSILKELDICESKLKEISYGMERSTGLVHKLVVRFGDGNASQSFNSFAQNESNLNKYGFSEMIKTGNNEFSNETNLSESILVISHHDDSFLNFETSYYGANERDDSFRLIPMRQSSEIDLDETLPSTISITSTHFDENNEQDQQDNTLAEESPADENEVEFYCNKVINEDNLDVIILFLQNPKRSGGGDVTSYTLDSNKRILTVKYAKAHFKTRVLTNKVLKFQHFKLIANEPFNKIKFQIDKRLAILRNMPSETALEFVQMLAENLVVNDDESNEVEQVVCSQLYNDTFYIKYKLEIDLNKARERLHKRIVFRSYSLLLINALSTRTIIVSRFDANNNDVSDKLVELYFMNEEKCGVADYSSMRETDDYFLITFESEESADMMVKNKHVISGQELVLESLYNFDFLNELNGMKPRVKQPADVTKKSLEDVNENEKQKDAVQKHDENKEKESGSSDNQASQISLPSVADKQSREKSVQRPVIYLNEKSNDLFDVLKHWNGRYYDQLVSDLFEKEAAVLKEEPDVIRIECSLAMPKTHDELNIWTNNVQTYLENFFAQFKKKVIEIKYPRESLSRIKYDLQRLKINRLDQNDELGTVELIGFVELVDHAEKVLVNMVFDSDNGTSNQSKSDQEKHDLPTKQLSTDADLKTHQTISQCYSTQAQNQMNNDTSNQSKSDQEQQDLPPQQLSTDGDLNDNQREVSQRLSAQMQMQTDIEHIREVRVDLQQESDVDHVQIRQNLHTKEIPADDLLLEFLQQNEQKVLRLLNEMNISCQIHPNRHERLIQITAADSYEIDRFINFLDDQINTNHLDPHSINDNLTNKQLTELVQRLNNNDGVLVKYLDDKIVFWGFSQRVNDAFAQCIDEL